VEDPFGGFTGPGIGIIAAVLGFNLFCLLLWFVITPLKRSHETNLRRVETFLTLLERTRADLDDEDEDLDKAVAGLTVLLEKGRDLGPLWGRKHLGSARLGIAGMAESWPELAGEVHRRMQLNAQPN